MISASALIDEFGTSHPIRRRYSLSPEPSNPADWRHTRDRKTHRRREEDGVGV